MTLLWIVGGTIFISLLSLVGAVALFLSETTLKKIILPLVSFSAGTLLAGAFLHLIPESINQLKSEQTTFLLLLVSFSLFLLMEQFIHWHHCHKMPSEHKAPVTYLILIADTLHNFIDGLAIGAAFIVNFQLGILTLLLTIFHEIPQELGDFGILINGGWDKVKALTFNLASGLAAVIGGLGAYFLASHINAAYLLPFAAGNFIYIATSDLIPEFKHSDNFKKNLIHFFFFVIGIIFIYFVTMMEV